MKSSLAGHLAVSDCFFDQNCTASFALWTFTRQHEPQGNFCTAAKVHLYSIDFVELADMKLIKAALSERFPQPLGMLPYMLGKIEALQKREGL